MTSTTAHSGKVTCDHICAPAPALLSIRIAPSHVTSLRLQEVAFRSGFSANLIRHERIKRGPELRPMCIRSCRISCLAPSITWHEPSGRRAANVSIASVETIVSSPAATISTGCGDLLRVAGLAEFHDGRRTSHRARPPSASRRRASDPVRSARRCVRSGRDRRSADCRQNLLPGCGRRCCPEHSARRDPRSAACASTRAAPTRSADAAKSISGAASTKRSNHGRPECANTQHRSRRPSSAPMRSRAAGSSAAPRPASTLRRRVSKSAKLANVAFARIGELPRRVPLPAPVHRRDRKAALAQIAHVSKYFSIASLRPVNTQTVPLASAHGRPPREAQSGAVRRRDHASDGTVGTWIVGDGKSGVAEAERTRSRR